MWSVQQKAQALKKTRFAALNPSDDIAAWVVDTVQVMGSGWCPPGVLGIGIGGMPEKRSCWPKKLPCSRLTFICCALKQEKGEKLTSLETLSDRINQLGIGAQRLAGLTAVLDIKILDYPTHAAFPPIAICPTAVQPYMFALC